MENDPFGNIESVSEVKMFLNYENLLSRAVDRCLFHRCNAVENPACFCASVQALVSAMVDLPGKPLRSEIKTFISELKKDGSIVDVHTLIFEKCTEILSGYGLLFKTSNISIGRVMDEDDIS